MIREVTHYSLHCDGRHVRNFSTESQARMYAVSEGMKGFTIVPVAYDQLDLWPYGLVWVETEPEGPGKPN